MSSLIKEFEQTPPEIVFEWKDKELGAEGWVVINSLKGGAAGGGTRMRKGLNRNEVESLAKTMEIKFTVSGPKIGGAKSGINFDPQNPKKEEVLKRWYKVIMPLLKNYYGTGGDLNIDELVEVIPITESYGLSHPQEGVVNGLFSMELSKHKDKIERLQYGVSKQVTNKKYIPTTANNYKIADLITGYGVSEAVKHYYSIWGGKIEEKRAIVQGWGNVGAAAGFYLANYGVKIVGIVDRDGGLINKDGFSFQEIKNLFLNKNGNSINAENLLPFEEINNEIWDLKADVFIPCAASRLITNDQLERMIANGMEVISAGANVPFADPEIFFGAIAEKADNNLSVIPDFISNCGMARVFAYLMSNDLKTITDTGIFEDTSNIIKNAIVETHKLNSSKIGIAKTAFEKALKQLV